MRAIEMHSISKIAWIGVFALILSQLLGGGTGSFILSDVLAEALCVPLLALAIYRLFAVPAFPFFSPFGWATLAICLFGIAIPTIQLIPLPPAIWTALPGRDIAKRGFELAQVQLPWMGISLSFSATRQAAISLIPAFTVLLATIQMNRGERRMMAWLLGGIGCLSILLGLLQVADGPASALRFFAFTNVEHSVGFFANRNHFAALLYAIALIAGALAAGLLLDNAKGQQAMYRKASLSPLALIIMLLFVLGLCLLGIVLTSSRAGWGLGAVAIIYVMILFVPYWGRPGARLALISLATVAAAGIVVGLQLNIFSLSLRLSNGFNDDVREHMSTLTRQAIDLYFPIGGGVGSFKPLYAALETPATSFETIVNRAHNDFLEWILEGGIPVVMLLFLVVAWLAAANLRAWVRPIDGTIGDVCLGRACAMVPVLFLIHSTVDYPLRTIAIMSIAAFCAGVCIEPRNARAESAP